MDDDHPADIGRPRRQGDRITPLFVAAAQGRMGRLCQAPRSADPRRCWPTCRAAPTASPSPIRRLISLDQHGVTFRWKDYRSRRPRDDSQAS